MTIVYRTSGPWGGGAGANLSAAQVDFNFYDVDQRVQYMELHPPVPVSIARFSATGSQFYIYMSDGTVQGPLTLPVVAWNFRGSWQPGTVYAINDVVVGPDNAVYVVLVNHSSGSAFDANANDGAGHNAYGLLLAPPAGILPTGGAPGYVLTKTSGTDYNVHWDTPSAPAGGNIGQVLQKNTSTDGDASWHSLGLSSIIDVRVTAPVAGDYLQWNATTGQWQNRPAASLNVLTASSWAPVLADSGAFMVLTNGGAITSIVIPADLTQNFPIGTELTVHQDGTGPVTIDGDVGVTILKHASFSNKLLGQYATATVKKTAANQWRLFGLLAAGP